MSFQVSVCPWGWGISDPMSSPWVGIPGTRSLLGVGAYVQGVGMSGREGMPRGWACPERGGYVQGDGYV